MSSDRTVAGVSPARTARPLNLADLTNVMRAAAAAGEVVGVIGGGSKINQGAAPTGLDVLISTASMNRILEHAAGDLVITVQAGAPLADVQRHVASAGQWLALDPPEVGATAGGIVAAAASGPRRLRYGTPRDLLIGLTVVLVDGTVAKSGGKVVKNVAGYDLGKLFTGSFGTLGVIAECTFRLHPLAPARRVVTVATDEPAVAAQRVYASGAVPTAMEWDGATMTAVFESIESAATQQAADVVAVLASTGGEVGEVTDTVPAGFGARPWRPSGYGLKLTHRIGALTEVLAVVRDTLPEAELRAHVGSGVTWLGAAYVETEVIEVLRTALAAYDGGVVVVEAPVELKKQIDVWGPARGIDVMRRIKDQFDPEHRMSPGRFVGGI